MSSVVCGIEISGSEAILVSLQGSKKDYSVIETQIKKIPLGDGNNQHDVKSFKQAIESYVQSNKISRIGIKARSKSGQFSGGGNSFKIEGLIQLLDVVVIIIHSATLAATMKKNKVNLDNQGINKYQREAFKVAYHLLED